MPWHCCERSKITHATHSWNIFTDNLFLIEIISHNSCYFSCWRSFVFLLQQPQSSSSSNNNNPAGEADQCRERLKKRDKHDGHPFSSCQIRFYHQELWEIVELLFFSLSDLSGCAISDPVPSITTVKTQHSCTQLGHGRNSLQFVYNKKHQRDNRQEGGIRMGTESKAQWAPQDTETWQNRRGISIQPLHVLQ